MLNLKFKKNPETNLKHKFNVAETVVLWTKEQCNAEQQSIKNEGLQQKPVLTLKVTMLGANQLRSHTSHSSFQSTKYKTRSITDVFCSQTQYLHACGFSHKTDIFRPNLATFSLKKHRHNSTKWLPKYQILEFYEVTWQAFAWLAQITLPAFKQ